MKRSHILSTLTVATLVVFAVTAACAAVEWKNLDEEHYVCGRRCSAGYLTGKVVFVCRDEKLALRMEEVWSGFKTKPFVLLGVYPKSVKGVSYPVYRDVALAEKSPENPLYVVEPRGRLRYRGADERRATEIIVTLLTDMESPKSEQQWRQFLDFEISALPGHAYLRYLDYKKNYPEGVKAYSDRIAELMKIPEVKKLAELVRFSKSVKDLRALEPKKAQQIKARLAERIDKAVSEYASLKDSANPLVVREAKNALADLAWAKAAL